MRLPSFSFVLVPVLLTLVTACSAVAPADRVRSIDTTTSSQPSASAPTAAADSLSLIDKWEGRWSNLNLPRGGEFYLIVRTVSGSEFKGVMYTETAQQTSYGSRELPVTGTVSGAPGSETLSFSYATFFAVNLARSGDTMVGRGCATLCSDIRITRKGVAPSAGIK